MMTKEDVSKVYRIILNPSHMKDTVKANGKISRRAVLLLCHLVEMGTAQKKNDKTFGLLSHLPDEVFEELQSLANDYLEEGKLVETHESLSELQWEK